MSFLELPVETIEHIVESLDSADMLRLSCSNQHIRSIIHSNVSSLNLKPFKSHHRFLDVIGFIACPFQNLRVLRCGYISANAYISLREYNTTLEELDANFEHCLDPSPPTPGRRCLPRSKSDSFRLTKLAARGFNFDIGVDIVANDLLHPSLTSLRLKRSVVTRDTDGFEADLVSHLTTLQNLCELSFFGPGQHYDRISCIPLLLQSLPLLRSLSVPLLQPADFRCLDQRTLKLEEFVISRSKMICADGFTNLSYLPRACSIHLRVVDIRRMNRSDLKPFEASAFGKHCPNMEVFRAKDPVHHSEFLDLVRNWPLLRLLHLPAELDFVEFAQFCQWCPLLEDVKIQDVEQGNHAKDSVCPLIIASQLLPRLHSLTMNLLGCTCEDHFADKSFVGRLKRVVLSVIPIGCKCDLLPQPGYFDYTAFPSRTYFSPPGEHAEAIDLNQLAAASPRLRALKITDQRYICPFDRTHSFAYLQALCIPAPRGSDVVWLVTACPQLRSLFVIGCSWTPEEILTVLNMLPHLRSLALTDELPSSITGDGTEMLVRMLTEYLHLQAVYIEPSIQFSLTPALIQVMLSMTHIRSFCVNSLQRAFSHRDRDQLTAIESAQSVDPFPSHFEVEIF